MCKHFLFNLEGFNIIDEKVVYSIIFGAESKKHIYTRNNEYNQSSDQSYIVDDLHIKSI